MDKFKELRERCESCTTVPYMPPAQTACSVKETPRPT